MSKFWIYLLSVCVATAVQPTFANRIVRTGASPGRLPQSNALANRSALAGASRTAPALRIADIQVLPDTRTQLLRIRVHLLNATMKPRRVMIAGVFTAAAPGAKWTYPALPQASVELPVSPAGRVITLGPVRWTPGKASWWWPNVPYQPGYHARLHQLTLSLRDQTAARTESSQRLQTQSLRFGFCTPGQIGSQYTLNGVRINLRGDNLTARFAEATPGERDGNAPNKPESRSLRLLTTDARLSQPGFLPPDKTNPGWPGAVRNYQKLNINCIRLDPSRCTPYMLDVCDDLGLLVIPAAFVYHNATEYNGIAQPHERFAKPAEALAQSLHTLILRDRNHPCVFKWSLLSEPVRALQTAGTQTGPAEQNAAKRNAAERNAAQPGVSPSALTETSQSLVRKLYTVCMEADGARPCSLDAGAFDTHTPLPNWPRFAIIEQNTQLPGTPNASGAQFSQAQPHGQTLLLGPAGSTPQSVVWVALQTRSLRARNNADIRLSSLRDLWPDVIPAGSRTQTRILDSKGTPALPEPVVPTLIDPRAPWQDPRLHLLQRSFTPVCAFDQEWDAANTPSNGSGFYPSVFPLLTPGKPQTRRLTVFNDEFAGETVELNVRLLLHPTRKESLSIASFVHVLHVPLGGHAEYPVPIHVPVSANNTTVEMQIIARKSGKERFRDRTFFLVQGTRGAQIRFINRDDKTQGRWQGTYGQQAFLLPVRGGRAQFADSGLAIQRGTGMESAAVNDLHHDREEDPNTLYEWDRTPVLNDPRLLPAGNGLTERHAIAFQGSQGMAIRIDARDGKPHHLALYLLDFARQGLSLDIDAVDLQGNPLDTRHFDHYDDGSYARYQFTGSVILILRSLTPNQNPLLAGVFIDP